MKVENLSAQLKLKYKLDKEAEGIAVTKVNRDSPAYDSGLKAGDIIMKFNKNDVKEVADFEKQVTEAQKSGANNAVLLVKRGNTNTFLVINFE